MQVLTSTGCYKEYCDLAATDKIVTGAGCLLMGTISDPAGITVITTGGCKALLSDAIDECVVLPECITCTAPTFGSANQVVVEPAYAGGSFTIPADAPTDNSGFYGVVLILGTSGDSENCAATTNLWVRPIASAESTKNSGGVFLKYSNLAADANGIVVTPIREPSDDWDEICAIVYEPTTSSCEFEEWTATTTSDVVRGSDGGFYAKITAGNSANDPVSSPNDWSGPYTSCESAAAFVQPDPDPVELCPDWSATNTEKFVKDSNGKYYAFRPQLYGVADEAILLATDPSSNLCNWIGGYDSCAEAIAAFEAIDCSGNGGNAIGNEITTITVGAGSITNVAYNVWNWGHAVFAAYAPGSPANNSSDDPVIVCIQPCVEEATFYWVESDLSTIIPDSKLTFRPLPDGTISVDNTSSDYPIVLQSVTGICSCDGVGSGGFTPDEPVQCSGSTGNLLDSNLAVTTAGSSTVTLNADTSTFTHFVTQGYFNDLPDASLTFCSFINQGNHVYSHTTSGVNDGEVTLTITGATELTVDNQSPDFPFTITSVEGVCSC